MTKEPRTELIEKLVEQYRIAEETGNKELKTKVKNAERFALLTLEEVKILSEKRGQENL